MEFLIVSKLQHFLSCSERGQYFNADSSLAGNLIHFNFRGNNRSTCLPRMVVFPIVWANQLLYPSVPDILAINSYMMNNILQEITDVYECFFHYPLLWCAWVSTHAAFGIVRNCCGIPSAAGTLPACSLFILHSGAMPLRWVGKTLGKQAHTSNFALPLFSAMTTCFERQLL